MVAVNIKLQGQEKVQRFLKSAPKAVRRASLFTVRRLVSELKKELGSSIPKAAQTSIAGYKKARARGTKPKARSRRIKGQVWMGTYKIPAIYAGVPRQFKNRVKVRSHVFENAFIATAKNGHKYIAIRTGKRTLKEAMIDLPKAPYQAKVAADAAEKRSGAMLSTELNKQLARIKK